MTLNEYQEKAMSTCMPSCNNFAYMFLNLVGEVGELASKVAKHIRKKEIRINDNHMTAPMTAKIWDTEHEEAMKQECGDILWQLSGLCAVHGWSLEEIAQMNLDKLASRKERGVIEGNGDNR